jgi:uncharacterized protein (DUF433 family)
MREETPVTDRLPPVTIHHPHVEVRDDLLGGSPVVRGTRVPVRRLWAWHRKGVSVETLVKRYPSLGWAKVLGGLAFAYDNEELVEADLDRERALLESDPERVPGRMDQTILPGVFAHGAPKKTSP